MTFPSMRDWLFSAKSLAAGALALFVAFKLGLEHPYWALTTVYVTTQPFAGATRAKGLWRLTGTIAGGAFAVAVLPTFVNTPSLLCLAFALWVACCLILSLFDPTPKSYAFMLAGYTAAIIGFPAVDAPETIFTTAVSRCEEICIGILCAVLVHGILLPRSGAPVLRARLTAWLNSVAAFAAQTLHGRVKDETFARERRHIALDGAALDALFHPTRYEVSSKAALLWLPVLRENARIIPGLVSFITDRAAALCKEDLQAHISVQPLLHRVAQWLSDTAPSTQSKFSDSVIDDLLMRIGDLGNCANTKGNWSGVLQEGIATRLRELVERWTQCLELCAHILATEPNEMQPPTEPFRIAGDTDFFLVAMSGVAISLTILIGCAFWISTGWASGAGVPLMAAITASIFAQQDDPAPSIAKFFWGYLLTVLIAAVLLFGVFPAIDGFPLLLLALALAYLPAGAFQAVPAFAPVALAVVVSLATAMGLGSSYSANFAVFANSSSAALMGIAFSVILNRLVRSVSVAWRVKRLVQADRADLLRLAEGESGELRSLMIAMFDRFEALAARLDSTDATSMGLVELSDLRASWNIVQLREVFDTLTPDLQQAVADVLKSLADELRSRGEASHTLSRIDAALNASMARECPADRVAALSLAGLRLARFPKMPPPSPKTPNDSLGCVAA